MEIAQELIDKIVDFLSDDLPTLAQLSLVSHQMRETSARHLYSHFDLRLTLMSGSKRAIEPQRLASILTTSPHLSAYITSLKMDILLVTYRKPTEPRRDDYYTMELFPSLQLIFSLTLRIKKLSVGHGSCLRHPPHFEALGRLTSTWPLLTYLEIEGLMPITLTNGLFSLKSLVVDDAYCSQHISRLEEAPHNGRPAAAHALQSLGVRSTRHDLYGDKLNPSGLFGIDSPLDLSQLRTLKLLPSSTLPDSFASILLKRSHFTLETFYLNMDNIRLSEGTGEGPLQFPSSLPRMRKLVFGLFSFRCPRYPRETQSTIDHIILMLRGLSKTNTPRLSTISMKIAFDRRKDESFLPSELDWRKLDEELTRIAEYGRLQVVRIELVTLGGKTKHADDLPVLLRGQFKGLRSWKGLVLKLRIPAPMEVAKY